MAPRSCILHRLTGLLAIAVAPLASVARAAPSSSPAPGFVVSHGRDCNVVLVAASYDDPGTDDAEFLELRVDGSPRRDASEPQSRADASDPQWGAEAGAGVDGSVVVDASAGPTLASCGLDALDLVDGANGGCATYRHIPVGTVPIPADGFVVFCAAGSTVDDSAHCDVTTAGRSALRAGWLQNGPNDGLRFVPVADGAVGIAYEGRPACFPSESVELASESGAASGEATVDDVNVACGGRFVLLPESAVPFRQEPTCPAPIAVGSDAAVFDADVLDGSDARTEHDAGKDAPWMPERAPPPANRTAQHTYGPLHVDAGLLGAEPAPRSVPKAPGCTVARDGRGGAAWLIAIFVGLALGLRLKRAKRALGRL